MLFLGVHLFEFVLFELSLNINEFSLGLSQLASKLFDMQNVRHFSVDVVSLRHLFHLIAILDLTDAIAQFANLSSQECLSGLIGVQILLNGIYELRFRLLNFGVEGQLTIHHSLQRLLECLQLLESVFLHLRVLLF
jgi:hypothetical protein